MEVGTFKIKLLVMLPQTCRSKGRPLGSKSAQCYSRTPGCHSVDIASIVGGYDVSRFTEQREYHFRIFQEESENVHKLFCPTDQAWRLVYQIRMRPASSRHAWVYLLARTSGAKQAKMKHLRFTHWQSMHD